MTTISIRHGNKLTQTNIFFFFFFFFYAELRWQRNITVQYLQELIT